MGDASDRRAIDRRGFLKRGAAIAPLALAGCDCAERCGAVDTRAEGLRPRELKMVTTWPKDFPGLGEAAERMASMIAQLSGGALRIRVFAAGELVGAFDAFDAVSGGSADLYHGADYYWTGKDRAYPFFTAVPFGMTAVEQMGWTEFGGGQALWDELAARFGIKPFAAGNTGHQMGGWFKREVRSLDELRSLRIRMPGLGGEVMRRAGASPVNIPGSEIYQALQSGAIEATEWVGPWNDLAFGLYREAPYYYWPGFHEPGAQLSVGVNLRLWEDMTAQERAVIETAARAVNHLTLAEYQARNAQALDLLVREHGVQLRRMPDDVMDALAKATADVLEDVAASSEIARRIAESYRESLRRSAGWNKISDEAYLAARGRAFGIE
ncbi:TRAP transporter substrate-binding protein [Parvularcula dongshanensis]|uniref:TRAP-type mannitol/chloroaromatic compound transport system substrate-binding protein n=1 Tax=Parvularcula dongshanensis TaxID=1173995 RepID=A0A840I4D2_9PROT|nr:TRAP transporter substrate-binding protein [Parvularcula dongshanensis]MBB4659123.1 TRAP-type mannitol/chloroaromatic compound transport system substrate-binding protein [Parvularcula dongshanensis]